MDLREDEEVDAVHAVDVVADEILSSVVFFFFWSYSFYTKQTIHINLYSILST